LGLPKTMCLSEAVSEVATRIDVDTYQYYRQL
jgi:hypothetical protein